MAVAADSPNRMLATKTHDFSFMNGPWTCVTADRPGNLPSALLLRTMAVAKPEQSCGRTQDCTLRGSALAISGRCPSPDREFCRDWDRFVMSLRRNRFPPLQPARVRAELQKKDGAVRRPPALSWPHSDAAIQDKNSTFIVMWVAGSSPASTARRAFHARSGHCIRLRPLSKRDPPQPAQRAFRSIRQDDRTWPRSRRPRRSRTSAR